jgi:hypothetical protein
MKKTNLVTIKPKLITAFTFLCLMISFSTSSTQLYAADANKENNKSVKLVKHQLKKLNLNHPTGSIAAPVYFGNVVSSNNFQIPYRFEINGKIGTKRNIGDGKILLPIYQEYEGNRLLFLDLRGRFDNLSSQEYNIGLGYRRLIEGRNFLNQNQWIVGTYAFLDQLTSKNKNRFLQLTIGAEALSEKFDLRGNIYLPQEKKEFVSMNTEIRDSVDFDTASTGIKDVYKSYSIEKPLQGFDLELGYKLPITAAKTKVFAGGYYFNGGSGFESVYGPRIRAEITFNNDRYKLLSKDIEISLNAEYSHDNLRKSQLFGGIKLAYQFGNDYQHYVNSANYNKNNLKNRMNEFLVRDVDIITSQKQFFPSRGDIYRDGIGGRKAYVIDAEKNSEINQALIDSINDKALNAIIITDGSKGDFTILDSIVLNKGQILSTQSTSMDIILEGLDNKKANTVIKTSRATINKEITNDSSKINDSRYLIAMNDNTALENFKINSDITENYDSENETVQIANKNNVLINGVSFAANLDAEENIGSGNILKAVNIESSENVAIIGRNGSSNSPDIKGYSEGIYTNNTAGNSKNITLADLYISNNERIGIYAKNLENLNLVGNINSNYNKENGIELINVSNFNNQSNLITNHNGSQRIHGGIMLYEVIGYLGNITANNNKEGIEIHHSNLRANIINTHDNTYEGIKSEDDDSILTCKVRYSSGNGVEGNNICQ